MKGHVVIMIALTITGLMMIAFASSLRVSADFGLLFLICPLIMLGMMFMTGTGYGRQRK